MNANNLPSFKSYGNYSSSNYGVNTLVFYMPNITIYYSYKTVVAFKPINHAIVVRENDWGPTTGKHLNWIDGGKKKSRVPGEKFEKMLKEVM